MSAPNPPSSLGSLIRRYLPAYLAGALMLAAFQLCMNRIDWLSKQAIDAIFSRGGGGGAAAAVRPALWMLLLAVLSFFTRVASRYFCFNAGRDIEYELRQHLLNCLHRLGMAFYRKMPAGEIMSRATNDLTQVRLLTGFGAMNLINVLFAVASALQVMLGISVRLTMASLVVFPLVMFSTKLFSTSMFTRTRKNQETLGRLTEVVQGNLAGVRVVKSFGLQTAEERRFAAVNQEYQEASLSLARLRGMMIPVVGSAASIGILAFFAYGSALLLRGPAQGGISEGDFFAFSLALNRMTWPMVALGFLMSILQRGRVSFARLKEVFDAQPEVKDGPLTPEQPLQGALRISGLSFAYGDRKVLDNVSFSLSAGESLAIVGRTGSGKTTLAMLLARLLPTPEGAVFLDEHDVCTLKLSAVRGVIGYAQQDAFLFSTTVARNIGFMLPDPDSPAAYEQIKQAAQAAQIYNELQDLPDKLDTIVGERGVQLSGGQKQRTALARALLWQPRLLILDDPLSAVDAKTEAAILEALQRRLSGEGASTTEDERSLLLITHRVAAAARCKRILVLDQGRVVESGSHDELLRLGGIYAGFAREQQRARELEELGQSDVPDPTLPQPGPGSQPSQDAQP
jgi:ATP-binding cassette subfamily B multidrug efflux pump